MMKRVIFSGATMAIALGVGYSVVSAGSGPLAPPEQAAQAAPERGEKHPAIRNALHALQRAQAYLTAASHDFGGHRADALRSVDEAIKQLKLAEQFDKK